MNKKQLYVIIPVFNERKTIGVIIDEILSKGYDNIIVVDDGSTDGTSELIQHKEIVLIKHAVNRGVGAATQTGLCYALNAGGDYMATLDGDSQHNTDDIEVLYESILNSNSDMVIGNRFELKSNKIPFIRVILNRMANLLTFLLCGRYFTDSQSGFKVLNRQAASIINLHLDGYEFCTELIIQAVKADLKIVNTPIHVYYSKESRRKGQNVLTGIGMVFNLLFHFSSKKN